MTEAGAVTDNRWVIYLDETGDHSLDRIDKGFPVFVLVIFLCAADIYTSAIVRDVIRLKLKTWGHEGVVLHSRDIRKAQNDFAFLKIPRKRNLFMQRLNQIMGGSEYTLITSAIHKEKHKETYGSKAYHPYHLSVKFCLERLVPFLEENNQREAVICAESRGKREDRLLEAEFRRYVVEGTEFLPSQRLRNIGFRIKFFKKERNIVGHQMADLAAYPIARYLISGDSSYRPFAVIRSKFYDGPGRISGLKIFPQ
ncbi:MAG: hypothetical protein MAG453_01407 [Calditrichaeota bacterium]|nr:hypothetical protein [Calditrichota bacterium]